MPITPYQSTGAKVANNINIVGNNVNTEYVNNLGSIYSNGITLQDGSGIIGNYDTNFVIPINEDEVVIDIVKATIEIFDFTKVKVKYNIVNFKTKKVENKEVNCISAERDLEPGELTKLKNFKNSSEVLLEFSDEICSERYGEKYVSKSYDFKFPIINQIMHTLISNDLVSVQPLGAPSGNLFYFDTVYGNGTTTGGYVQNTTTTDNPTYTIGNITTCIDENFDYC